MQIHSNLVRKKYRIVVMERIGLLREHTDWDYVIVRPSPKPDAVIQIVDPAAKLEFSLSVNRAMKSGDPQSVVEI